MKMDLSKKSVGKILKIDYDLGYGEIVTDDCDICIFTTNNISCHDKVNQGELVKFREEKRQDYDIAFFVNKIESKEDIKKYLKK
jgi:hypothetical protein